MDKRPTNNTVLLKLNDIQKDISSSLNGLSFCYLSVHVFFILSTNKIIVFWRRFM